MNPWHAYETRLSVRGETGREAVLKREQRFIKNKLPKSLSYKSAVIDGEERNLAIINSDFLNIKTLCSLPGEDLPHGGLVRWADNYWLITEKDPDNEVYTKCTMQQCNYLLRWIDKGQIIERWCIIEDGTKYLSGEFGDNEFIMSRGDARVGMIIARDEYTVNLDRENRFLIDDYGSQSVLAYRLTKPFKMSNVFNEKGVFKFVLQECSTEDDDNFELHIADYYKYFPRESVVSGSEDDTTEPTDTKENNGKKVWI